MGHRRELKMQHLQKMVLTRRAFWLLPAIPPLATHSSRRRSLLPWSIPLSEVLALHERLWLHPVKHKRRKARSAVARPNP
jgi:hypothetical protein